MLPTTFPFVPTLQTLTCLVDTAPTHDPATLHAIFDPYTELLDAEAWRDVLVYTYALLTPIEAELMLLRPRLQQLGAALGKPADFLQRVRDSEPAAPRPLEARGWCGVVPPVALTVNDGPRVRDLVVVGVSVLKATSVQRARCLGLVAAWAQQAVDRDVV
ncbi:hypothetical protein LTR36_010730 [Oleoguttula mirabilis]|uniref:Uncharacterized protein n=1 Tax=Oleoguttula mirabilis TaxID=1507867 RepID=A0AAV9JTV7_9PEZI|nr:hypothetical protein LTR36_010730 [Oleoguttula mirabilis]